MNQLRHFIFAGLVLAWACAKDLPRFPELTTELHTISLDSLQVTTTMSGYSDQLVIKEAGVLWGYDEGQLTLDGAGVNRIPATGGDKPQFVTTLSDLPFSTIIYVCSYAILEHDGEFVVYSPSVTHSIGAIQLISTFRIINHQVTVLTNVTGLPDGEALTAFGHAWVNIDSVPGAAIELPHATSYIGAISKNGNYSEVLPFLGPATNYRFRSWARYHDRLLYGNTLDVFIGDVWQRMKDFHIAMGTRWGMVAVTVGDYAYAGMGEKLVGDQGFHEGTPMKDWWRYDASTDKWQKMASFPDSVRYLAIAFAIEDKVYVGTGRQHNYNGNSYYFRDFYEYTPPPVDTWRAVTPFPYDVRSAVGFAIKGKGYVCTGIGEDGTLYNRCYEFDPKSNANAGAWRLVAPFPGAARKNAVAFVIGDNAYVGTGKDGLVDDEETSGKLYDDFYVFDPGQQPDGTWMRIRDFPGGARYAAMAFSDGRYGYVGTGASTRYPSFKDLWRYDPATDTWTQRENVGYYNRRNLIAFSLGKFAYAGMGPFLGATSNIDNDLWRYAPEK